MLVYGEGSLSELEFSPGKRGAFAAESGWRSGDWGAGIDVASWKDFVERHAMTEFGFGTIKAEGVRLVIGVGPEGNGESPVDGFRRCLALLGSEIRRRAYDLLAMLEAGS